MQPGHPAEDGHHALEQLGHRCRRARSDGQRVHDFLLCNPAFHALVSEMLEITPRSNWADVRVRNLTGSGVRFAGQVIQSLCCRMSLQLIKYTPEHPRNLYSPANTGST